MKLIYRYLIREFIKPLVFTTLVFGGLVLISEFFRELNFYLENKTPFTYVLAYLALNLPWWTIQVLPVSVLLAVLFALGDMGRRNEITALKAAGVNPWRIMAVMFFCGLCIGATEIGLREKVIPATVRMAERIRHEKIRKEPFDIQFEYRDLVVSLPDNGRMTIGYLNAKDKVMRQVVADYYNDSFLLTRQLLVQEARYKNGTWHYSGGVERVYSSSTTVETVFDAREQKLPFAPEDFIITRVRPEQKSSPEYIMYIRQLENLGVPTEKERIQYHLRWSSVFSHLVVMLIGIPFALGMGSRHGKMISFTFALIFAFVYWGVQAVGQSMGENKLLTPVQAAWMGNSIFGVFGLYLAGRLKK